MEKDVQSSLVAHQSGVKKSNAVVVMPFGGEEKLLASHLRILSEQSTKDFDVLIIGKAPPQSGSSLNIIHYSEKLPLGSSGSFGIGQIVAYNLGYQLIANADIDCVPSSQDFMEKLLRLARDTGKAILPLSDEQGIKGVYCINRYGMVPSSAMQRCGFEYVRFFKGAEDIDYQLRLEGQGLLLTSTECKTTHPYLSMVVFEVASRGSKYLYYHRAGQAILTLGLYRCLAEGKVKDSLLFAGRIAYSYCFNLAYYFGSSSLLLEVSLDGLMLNLSKHYKEKCLIIPQSDAPQGGAIHALVVGENEGKLQDKRRVKESGMTIFEEWEGEMGAWGRVARRMRHMGSFLCLLWAKGEYFEPSERFIEGYGFFIPYLMFLKPVSYKKKFYSWNRGPLHLAAGAALAAISLPLLPLLVCFALAKVRWWGDYPPKEKNAPKMLGNFFRDMTGD